MLCQSHANRWFASWQIGNVDRHEQDERESLWKKIGFQVSRTKSRTGFYKRLYVFTLPMLSDCQNFSFNKNCVLAVVRKYSGRFRNF